MILNLTRTGSNWTRTAARRAGQAESDKCILCGRKEDSGHMWHCEALRTEREEADHALPSLDPHQLHPAIRHGVAPAMSARLNGSFWGTVLEDTSHANKKLLGNVPEGMTPSEIRHITDMCEASWTGKEVSQHYTSRCGTRAWRLRDRFMTASRPQQAKWI